MITFQSLVFHKKTFGDSSPVKKRSTKLGGGFKYSLFSPLFGEDFHFDEHIFQRGWFNHQLEKQPEKV